MEKRFASRLGNVFTAHEGKEFEYIKPKSSYTKKLSKGMDDSEQTGDLSYISDKFLMQGVSTNRDVNWSNYDYLIDDSNKYKGVRALRHKFFHGSAWQYYLLENQDQID